MLLSSHDIRIEPDIRRVVPDPCDPEVTRPASVDVRLDRWFRLFGNHHYPIIDPTADQEGLTHLVNVGANELFILHPGGFVLGTTYERITLPDDVVTRLEGKSNLEHLGPLTHPTAEFIDPGFTGHVTLGLSNTTTMPIELWPRMKVERLRFFRLSSPTQTPYGSGATGLHYQSRRGPTASHSRQSFHRTRIPDTPAAPVDGVAPVSQEKHL